MSYFDEKAATWDDRPDRVQRAQDVAVRMGKLLDLDRVINALDYGSGTGLLSFCLKDQLRHITLMDDSEGMTQKALEKCEEQKILNLHPIQGDLLDKDLDTLKIPRQFELIFSLLTLHHVKNTNGLLSKFKKLMAPDGALVIIDLEKEDGSFHDDEFHGHTGFERKPLEGQLIMAGFNPYYYEICFEIEKDDGSRFPVFLMLARG